MRLQPTFRFSQAVKWADLLFCSGMIEINPKTGKLVKGMAGQLVQTLENLKAVLAAGGSGFDKVLKTLVFLVRQSDVAAMNAVYARYFPTPRPARSCIIVQALPRPGVEVEIELIARTK
jgi:2-iminobutanoate/2-iminopropanoate deaminase